MNSTTVFSEGGLFYALARRRTRGCSRQSFRKGGPDESAARETLARVVESVPIGRYREADELAAVALFLPSDESSYMLGTEIAVDGGEGPAPRPGAHGERSGAETVEKPCRT